MSTIINATLLDREPSGTARLRQEVNTSAMKFLTDIMKWAAQKAQDEGKNPEIECQKVLSLGWVKYIVVCNQSRWAGKANPKPIPSARGPEVLQKAETFEKKFKEVKPAKKVVKAQKLDPVETPDYMSVKNIGKIVDKIDHCLTKNEDLPLMPEKAIEHLEDSLLYQYGTAKAYTLTEYKATKRFTNALREFSVKPVVKDPKAQAMLALFG